MPRCDVRTLDTPGLELKPSCNKNPESMLGDPSGLNHVLFGLPCARCRAYYEADLDTCPICGCKERVPSTQGSPRSVQDSVPLNPMDREVTSDEDNHSDGSRSVFSADSLRR